MGALVSQFEKLYASPDRVYLIPFARADAAVSAMHDLVRQHAREFSAGMVAIPYESEDSYSQLAFTEMDTFTAAQDKLRGGVDGIVSVLDTHLLALYCAARVKQAQQVAIFASVHRDEHAIAVCFEKQKGLLLDPSALEMIARQHVGKHF